MPLEGEQVISLVGDDLVGDGNLTARGIDADERTFELLCLGKLIQKIRDRGDLIGLLWHAQLQQDQPRMGGIGAQGMEGLSPLR